MGAPKQAPRRGFEEKTNFIHLLFLWGLHCKTGGRFHFSIDALQSALSGTQALLVAECDPKYHQIFDSLVGILFLGAIHNHQYPKLEKSLIRCVAAEINVSKSDRIFRAWNSSQSTTIFRDTCARFDGLNRKFRIVSLYEVEEASKTWRFRRSSSVSCGAKLCAFC